MVKAEFKELETKFVATTRLSSEAKIVGDDGRISGYAAIFNEKDRGNDVIVPGAFKKLPLTLPMFWAHDSKDVIGAWDSIEVDEVGLKVSGRLIEGVARAAEVKKLVEAGAVGGMSIGYITHKSERKKLANGDTVRYLHELEVFEVSLTSIPMMPLAKIDGAKSIREPITEVLDFLRAFRTERGM